MGIFTKLIERVKRIFRKKPKEEEKEVKDIVVEDIKEKGFIDKAEDFMDNLKNVTLGEDRNKGDENELKELEVEKEVLIKERESTRESLKEKKKEIKRFQDTPEKARIRGEMVRAMDNIGYLDIGGNYHNNEDLSRSLFGIYRGVIMKNINDDEFAASLFKTGRLQDRINTVLTISGYQISKGIMNTFTRTIQILRTSPEEILKTNIFSMKGSTFPIGELRRKISQIGSYTGRLPGLVSGDITITELSVSFNYA